MMREKSERVLWRYHRHTLFCFRFFSALAMLMIDGLWHGAYMLLLMLFASASPDAAMLRQRHAAMRHVITPY